MSESLVGVFTPLQNDREYLIIISSVYDDNDI